jgi:hypothetical protein
MINDKLHEDLIASLKSEIKISEKDIVSITNENKNLDEKKGYIQNQINSAQCVVQKLVKERNMFDEKIRNNRIKINTIRSGLNSKHKTLQLTNKLLNHVQLHNINETQINISQDNRQAVNSDGSINISQDSILQKTSNKSNLTEINDNYSDSLLSQLFSQDEAEDNQLTSTHTTNSNLNLKKITLFLFHLFQTLHLIQSMSMNN